jgi:hypothetical protein
VTKASAEMEVAGKSLVTVASFLVGAAVLVAYPVGAGKVAADL